MKKYLLAFLSMFAICPCPLHGTILGVAAIGAVKGVDVVCKHRRKKELDKHCDAC
jgi:hypothetical protein